MVGRQVRPGSKSFSTNEHRVELPDHPPPYQSIQHSPTILAETTTVRTQVITTTTTTHFLSFPLWKKRSLAPMSPTRNSTTSTPSRKIQHDTTRSRVRVHAEEIPPLPSRRVSSGRRQPLASRDLLQHEETVLTTQYSNQSLDTTLTRPSTGDSLPSMQSTTALARASLGLGLPHILPTASPSTDIGSAAFARSASQGESTPFRAVRRSKSAQKLGDVFFPKSETATKLSGEIQRTARTRGLSFNSSSLFNISSKPDSKGKNKDQPAAPERPSTSPQTASKSITRRASFWMRKKSTLDPSPTVPPPSDFLGSQLSQLPALQPLSPFDVNIKPTSLSPSPPSNNKSAHSRGLSRSYSTSSTLRSQPPDIGLPPSTDRPPDSYERSKNSSLFLPSATVEHSDEQRMKFQDTQSERRPRAQTNPLFLNRLSLSFLPTSSSPVSTSPPPLPRTPQEHQSPSRPTTSSSAQASLPIRNKRDIAPLRAGSSIFSDSPRTSLTRDKNSIPLPLETEESPEIYVKRLQRVVSKAEIASILAISSDTFYARALQSYITQFDFAGDPLDVALRKLLMEVGLPRETQQIDRVIEAFASRYLHCNPDLFTSDDQPYILAFSLIMLHTDAFNKSNKRKMSKADYVKNTRLPGVASQVLDCFYDNIVFAPFIFIEDPLDINGQRGLATETPRQSVYLNNAAAGTPAAGNPLMKPKVDPYYLITNNLLAPLRVNVQAYIPIENPYSYEGTAGPWNEAQLQIAFAKASQIEVSAVSDSPRVSPFFGLGSVGGLVSPVSATSVPTGRAEASHSPGDVWMLKLTKVGLLNRKDDILEGGRKAISRKWRQWSVVLTGSQLLFFRDPAWTSILLNFQSVPSDGRMLFPQSALFKPDELISVKDTIAVYDKFYTKHEHTLRFVLSDGRHLLLQTPNEVELNDWIASINYASAFKSAGIRMRPLEMSRIDVKLTGVAAATSHLHDLQMQSSKPHVWDNDAPRDLMGMLSPDFDSGIQKSTSKTKLTIDTRMDDMDLEVPVAPEIDGAEQFKLTFDQVKADLAAGRLMYSVDQEQRPTLDKNLELPPMSAIPTHGGSSSLPSRAQIIQAKISDLESRITPVESRLDNYMRLIRNITKLTPFQKSTRDRLTTLVQNLAQDVMQGRLDLIKLTCHRNVLLNDLKSEGQAWNRSRTVALQAATETLRSRRQDTTPRLTLSHHTSESFKDPPQEDSSPSRHHLLPASPARRSESSICESFHSALDFGPDWPLPEHSSNFLEASSLFQPPSSSVSLNSDDPSDDRTDAPKGSSTIQRPVESPRTSNDVPTHEKFYTALESPEEAEQWDQTRCAQRVSLVKIPSDIDLKSRLSRRYNGDRNASAGKASVFQHLPSATFIA